MRRLLTTGPVRVSHAQCAKLPGLHVHPRREPAGATTSGPGGAWLLPRKRRGLCGVPTRLCCRSGQFVSVLTVKCVKNNVLRSPFAVMASVHVSWVVGHADSVAVLKQCHWDRNASSLKQNLLFPGGSRRKRWCAASGCRAVVGGRLGTVQRAQPHLAPSALPGVQAPRTSTPAWASVCRGLRGTIITSVSEPQTL